MSTKISGMSAFSSPVLASDYLPALHMPGGVPDATGPQRISLAQIRAAFMPVALASDVNGTLPVANGGTGQTALITAIPALNIDWSQSYSYTKTLAAGANTITFSNQVAGQTIVVRITGAASTLTWPTVKWPGGSPPTQTASGTDIYTFYYDGTNTYGSYVQAMA